MPGVRTARVERDEVRERLTLLVTDRAGTTFPARDLSDAALRFLPLVAMDYDPSLQGVICIEEPESGVHPRQIPDVLKRLEDIAMGADFPVDEGNAFRQVMVITHSPGMVMEVDDDHLVYAWLINQSWKGERIDRPGFGGLKGTWREADDAKSSVVPFFSLLNYLFPVSPEPSEFHEYLNGESERDSPMVRVRDREDLRALITQKQS